MSEYHSKRNKWIQEARDAESKLPLQHLYLVNKRDQYPDDQALADAEHYFYGKAMRGMPGGMLTGLLAIPGYDISKRMGLMNGRSKPGMNQMMSAFQGLMEED